MKTVVEYTKERFSSKNDVLKTNAITMVLASAKNNAKLENRDVSSQDLIESARAHIKTLRKSIKDFEQKMDTSIYSGEIEATKKVFFPDILTLEETRERLSQLLISEECTRKNRKNIENKIRADETLDWEVVSNTLNEVLK